MKDEYEGSDTIFIYIRGLMDNMNMMHRGADNNSEWNAWYYYVSLIGENAQESISGARASRRDYSNWHHYALVSTGDRFEMYMDGVLVSYSVGDRPAPTTGTGLYINMKDTAYIDELRISATARSVDELWDYVQYVKTNNLLPD